MKKSRLHFILTALLLSLPVTAAQAQQLPPAVYTDPVPDKAHPPTMDAPDIISHGKRLNAIIYTAAGAGPHGTVVLLHGFPGNEQNMDLAYAIRRAGWNVLVPHYRGSWGSEGDFSFSHAIEDTAAAVGFLRAPANVAKYHVDVKRIVLIGHSMGGFMAAYDAAHDPDIAAVGMIAAWDIGADMLRLNQQRPNKEGEQLFVAESSRLAGSTPKGLIAEAKKNATEWNFVDWAKLLKDRPALIVEPDDDTRVDNKALAYQLRKHGGRRVTEVHIPTDHPFSDHRIALQVAVVRWLGKISSQ